MYIGIAGTGLSGAPAASGTDGLARIMEKEVQHEPPAGACLNGHRADVQRHQRVRRHEEVEQARRLRQARRRVRQPGQEPAHAPHGAVTRLRDDVLVQLRVHLQLFGRRGRVDNGRVRDHVRVRIDERQMQYEASSIETALC